jgi:heat-inducible transcriptional repressor
MDEITDRQKVLLTLIMHEYINQANPIGSKILVERFNLGMSSATVRNEMSYLTEMGYLRQPHTSAGRVPTEKGYRFFVGRLDLQREIPLAIRRTITHQFYQMRNDVEQWVRLAATILADQSKAASIITAPHPASAKLKHVEFISTRGRQILMVLVLIGGEIRQRIQSLTEPVSQVNLSAVGTELTTLFQGFEVERIRKTSKDLNELECDLLQWVIEEMDFTDSMVSGQLYTDGITNVLAEPEFFDSEEARKALRVLEERSMLQDLMARTIQNDEEGNVQVIIGGEGNWDDLRQCSIVLSKYGAPGIASGTIGVLGPIRMAYGQTISTVRFMSGLLSDLVLQTLFDDQLVSSGEVDE